MQLAKTHHQPLTIPESIEIDEIDKQIDSEMAEGKIVDPAEEAALAAAEQQLAQQQQQFHKCRSQLLSG